MSILRLGDGDEIEVHPAAGLFPMMSEAELDQLAADIAKNGLRQNVVFLGKNPDEALVLLDGRNRFAAIARIAEESRRDELVERARDNCVLLDYGGTDPFSYVVSANLHRRHLTAEQKREIIAALLKAQPERSDNATAKIAKASDKTVASVRRELEGRSEIPNVSARTDAQGRQQPARKQSGVKSPQILNRSKKVTAGNANGSQPPPDPVTELCGRVKAELIRLSPPEQNRLLSGLEEIITHQRRYAHLPPELAAKRKAGAERKRRCLANKRQRRTMSAAGGGSEAPAGLA
jgi:hypothetical protein